MFIYAYTWKHAYLYLHANLGWAEGLTKVGSDMVWPVALTRFGFRSGFDTQVSPAQVSG